MSGHLCLAGGDQLDVPAAVVEANVAEDQAVIVLHQMDKHRFDPRYGPPVCPARNDRRQVRSAHQREASGSVQGISHELLGDTYAGTGHVFKLSGPRIAAFSRVDAAAAQRPTCDNSKAVTLSAYPALTAWFTPGRRRAKRAT